jgi:hypothetical protein
VSGKYDFAREAFGKGELSWTADDIVAQLVSAQYLFSAAHRDSRDLRGLVGAALELTGKSINGGWAKCDKLVFRQVDGANVAAIVFRRAAQAEADTTLIFFHNEVANFPMVTNGGDIEVEVPARGIFRL